MYFDPLYFVFMIPALLLVMFAQFRVTRTFKKYSNVPNQRRITGAEVAAQILQANGITDVPIEYVPGTLSDHYDPRSRTLRLSDPVYGARSVAALGVAAHEVGHAIQHARGYAPLQARSALVPVAGFGSRFGIWVLLAGVLLNVSGMAWAGVALFGAATLFALVTLPVEFNASSRALAQLTTLGIVDRTELGQARQVLSAAALTYVAGFAAALLTLLYWITVVSGMNRRN
ncbi:MAG TPA: zinc metallopeptidase [Thermomicrobiales bacterium]|nr:zinc metallopeptidase [Thermomicrobiales bacterium]